MYSAEFNDKPGNGRKVIIVGAGVGGLSLGALLAQRGFKVEIFDRNTFPGGKATSFEREGYVCDRYAHAAPQANSGPHKFVTDKLGIDSIPYILKDVPFIIVDQHNGQKRQIDLPRDINPIENLAKLAIELGVEEENFNDAAACLGALLEGDPELIKAKADVTVRDFIMEYTNDEQFHRFNSMMAFMMFCMPYHITSAGEYLYCFNAMFGGAQYGYLKGGFSSIPNAFLKGFEKYGGRLHLGKGVKKIVVKNNKAVGVETEDGFVAADIVISNAGLPLTIKLVGEENLPAAYVKWAKEARHADSVVAIRYALDKKIIEEPFFFSIPDESSAEMFHWMADKNGLPKDTLFFIPVPSNWDDTLAPPGKQVVIAATGCRNEFDSSYQAVIDIMDKRFRELWPEINGHIVWRDLSGPKEIAAVTGKDFGECIGLGQIPGQVGDNRPKCKLPIENLWAVGADFEGRGIGTDMAVDSAIKANNQIF